MKISKLRSTLVIGLLLAGCGTSGVPSGVSQKIGSEAEAARMYALLDQDPAAATVKGTLSQLGVNATVSTSTSVAVGDTSASAAANANVGSGGANGTAVTTTGLSVATNANVSTGVDQTVAASTNVVSAVNVTASSTLNDTWFSVNNCTDGNTHSAWAPAANDANPSLTLDLGTAINLTGLNLKMSPQGVVVDVDVRESTSGAWTSCATNVVPVYRQLHWLNLKAHKARQVRLTFHGMVDGHLLVCEVQPFGNNNGASAVPSMMPSVMPSVAASVAPTASTLPSASPSASTMPSVTPTASPSASVAPSASPSASMAPSSAPTASPTAVPSASPTTSATATPPAGAA